VLDPDVKDDRTCMAEGTRVTSPEDEMHLRLAAARLGLGRYGDERSDGRSTTFWLKGGEILDGRAKAAPILGS
jgi:hypothetical protein